MNHDLSYLRTDISEYARNKMIESYDIEEEEAKRRKKEQEEAECKQSRQK